MPNIEVSLAFQLALFNFPHFININIAIERAFHIAIRAV